MLEGMKTKDVEIPTVDTIMKRRVEAFSPELDIATAIDKLLRRGYSGAPVVDGEGKLVGVLSEHDCIRVLAEALYEDWPTGTVADHMSATPETVEASDDLLAVAQTFTEHQLRRLPVVHEGKLVGLVTRRDLMRGLDELLRARGKHDRPTAYELIQAQRQEVPKP